MGDRDSISGKALHSSRRVTLRAGTRWGGGSRHLADAEWVTVNLGDDVHIDLNIAEVYALRDVLTAALTVRGEVPPYWSEVVITAEYVVDGA